MTNVINLLTNLGDKFLQFSKLIFSHGTRITVRFGTYLKVLDSAGLDGFSSSYDAFSLTITKQKGIIIPAGRGA